MSRPIVPLKGQTLSIDTGAGTVRLVHSLANPHRMTLEIPYIVDGESVELQLAGETYRIAANNREAARITAPKSAHIGRETTTLRPRGERRA